MAKGRLMAFRFFVDDWEGGTSYLSNEEAGAYIRLLIFQFRNDFIEPDMFLRICQNDEKIMAVLSKKFKQKKGAFYNERMVKAKDDTCKYVEKQSLKGKKSAQLRSNRGSTTVEPFGSGSGSGSIKGGVGENPKPKEYYYDLFDKIKADELFLESCQKTYRMSAAQTHYQLQQFFREKLGLNLTWESPHDCRTNFFYWLGKRGDDIRMPVPDTPANVDKKAIDDFYNSRMNPIDRAGRQTEEFIIEGEEDE